MVERIIFIEETRFTERNYQRFGIELLKQNGFKVELLDFTSILHPELAQKYCPPDFFNYDFLTVFHDKTEAYNKLSALSSDDFVVSFIAYNCSTLGIYRALSKSHASYAVSYVNALPVPVVKKSGLDSIIEKLKKPFSIRHLETRRRLFMKLPSKWLGIKSASLVLAAGDRCFNYHYPVNDKTEVLQIHAFDYDLYLREKDIPNNEKPIAVFLDQFVPFHPDFIMMGNAHLMGVDKYYRLLNNFFDFIEKKSGLEVVIAAHPRSYYDKLPDYFNKRKCIRGNTISLVKECRLVLGQSTTAFNFANLFYKPAIFITYSDFSNTWEGHYIREMAKQFGKTPILIDKVTDIDLESELKVSRTHYENYRKGYIKTGHSQNMPFWQIFANRIKEKYCNQKQGEGYAHIY